MRDVATFQIDVSSEDSLQIMSTLSKLELQLTDFTELQPDSPEVAAALSQAQSKITEARTKLIEQQQTEVLELQRADTEVRLLEDSAATYQHEIDALERELPPLLLEDLRDPMAAEPGLLEDSRFEVAAEAVADSELLPTDTTESEVASAEPWGSEIIEDAEFEEITDEAVEDGPRVNDSLEMTRTETDESVNGEVSWKCCMDTDITKLTDTLAAIEGLLNQMDQTSSEISESLELLRMKTTQAHESFSTIASHVQVAKKASATKLINLTRNINQ